MMEKQRVEVALSALFSAQKSGAIFMARFLHFYFERTIETRPINIQNGKSGGNELA